MASIGVWRKRRVSIAKTLRRFFLLLCCLLFYLGIQTIRNGSLLERNQSASSQNSTRYLYEARHVAFLKVHKTGSSTIQNIFIRFGESRNLTFILGRVTRADQECNGWSSCISLKKTLSDDVIVPPPRDRKYEILCSHVIYNKEMFSKYLPSDTKLIASVREPIKRLESAIAHFKTLRGTNMSAYAKDPLNYDHPMLNNAMAFEFGFDKSWFPTKYKKAINSTSMMEAAHYLAEVIDDFHLILINERFDESLVFMKRLLNWKTEDILYSNKLSRSHDTFKNQDIKTLQEYLYLDYLLYDYSLQIFNAKVANAGPDFNDEVAGFKLVRSKVLTFCNNATNKSTMDIGQSTWHQPFVVTKKLCNNINRQEFPYLNLIRQKQYGTVDTV